VVFSGFTREYIFIIGERWLVVNILSPWFDKTILESCFFSFGTLWSFVREVWHGATWSAVSRRLSRTEIPRNQGLLNDHPFIGLARALGSASSVWTDRITLPSQLSVQFPLSRLHSS
jgi:hypothetical protein